MSAGKTLITPGRFDRQYWRDLWNYRELFYFLAWRDIKVKYKQTVIGVAWALIGPVVTMVVFSVIFGKLANFPSEEGVPYPVLVFAALLPWKFFSQSLTSASNSLVGNVNLISKVYMPRLIIPASKIVVSFVDFLISFAVLGALMLYYGFAPSGRIVLLPLFLFVAFIASYGLSLLLSALNVKYRDLGFIVPFIVQIGLYISPVGFKSDIIPDRWRLLYSANPMVGVIDGFRWAILGGDVKLYAPGIWLSLTLITCVFIAGLLYFRHTERTFADFI